MKKIIYLLFLSLFVSISCNQEDEIIDSTVKRKQDKVSICHYDSDMDSWKTISINGNALKAHLEHGDVRLIDADGDGWVTFENECVPGGDCDDTNADVNPGAVEIVYNGVDDDCNPLTLDDDLDEDGFPYAEDCDDTDANINPDAEEICYNGIDDNCNGEVDEDCIPSPQIGDFYEGGIIFYILKPGDMNYVEGEVHGLIASPVDASNDQNDTFPYDTAFPNSGSSFTSTVGIGYGLPNTNQLISEFGLNDNYAAGAARAYTGGGFTDWFLPSKDELNQLYVQKTIIDAVAVANGGNSIETNGYWSSSEEFDITLGATAWAQFFLIGDQHFVEKQTYLNVRPVREF